MIKMLRHRFDSIPDTRRAASVNFPLTDVLMAAYAMFYFKDASLLAFQNRFEGPNVRSIFGIRDVPSDTQMREILDPISEEPLHEAFADLLRLVISEKDLLKFRAEDGRYYAAIDGTGYFSSERVHCDRCQEKRHKNGSVTYSHHAVAMVLLHPDRTEVLPLGVEPILKQDGNNKNDCERNAVRRLLKRVRLQHPTLPLTVIEDGLASNGPHIRDLKEAKCHFILGAKPGDHQHLFDQAIAAGDRGELHNIEAVSPQLKNGKRETQWASGLALNSSHPDLRVTFLSQHDFDRRETNCGCSPG